MSAMTNDETDEHDPELHDRSRVGIILREKYKSFQSPDEELHPLLRPFVSFIAVFDVATAQDSNSQLGHTLRLSEFCTSPIFLPGSTVLAFTILFTSILLPRFQTWDSTLQQVSVASPS